MFKPFLVCKGQFSSHTLASTTWCFMEMFMGSQLHSKHISRDGRGFPGHIVTTHSAAFVAVAKVFVPTQ